jgi:hypothetical protein
MMKRLLAAAAALALTAGVAQAATITVSKFTKTNYINEVATFGPSVVRENFENYVVGNVGNGTDNPGFGTNVGTFWTMGGTGSGGTVRDPNPDLDGTKLAIRTGSVYGRSSTTDLLASPTNIDNPNDGILDKFLDSNDTFGIRWNVDIGSMFTKLVFVLTDATDVGAQMTIKTEGASNAYLFGLGEANRRLVVIDFGGAVPWAEITFFNSNKNTGEGFINDGFSIDDVAVSAVPLPAPALMLLAGLGGLAALRRKRAAA